MNKWITYSFRCGDLTAKQIKELKALWGTSKSEVIVKAIERAWLQQSDIERKKRRAK